MPDIDIQILPLSLGASDDDIRGCAALINRRHQFEPNRLRDLTRPEEERLQSRVRQLKQQVTEPRCVAYLAKNKSKGEVVGWISWLKPAVAAPPSDTSNTVAEAIQLNTIVESEHEPDYERDHEAVNMVRIEKKAKEAHFFGTQSFW